MTINENTLSQNQQKSNELIEKIKEVREAHPLLYADFYNDADGVLKTVSEIKRFSELVKEKDLWWTKIYRVIHLDSLEDFILSDENEDGQANIQATEAPNVFHRFVNLNNMFDFVYEFSFTKDDLARALSSDYAVHKVEVEGEEPYNVDEELREIGWTPWLEKANQTDTIEYLCSHSERTHEKGHWINASVHDHYDGVETLEEMLEVILSLGKMTKELEYLAEYDYADLDDAIETAFGTRRRFAQALVKPESALSKRMNNMCTFQMKEIENIMLLLKKPSSQIGTLFFSKRSWKKLVGDYPA